jgi:hypothetical protein
MFALWLLAAVALVENQPMLAVLVVAVQAQWLCTPTLLSVAPSMWWLVLAQQHRTPTTKVVRVLLQALAR